MDVHSRFYRAGIYKCMHNSQSKENTIGTHRALHAPTDSISGMYPSLRLRSRRLTSSIDVALAMAALTFSASSFDIKRPAFPISGAAFGSSLVIAALEDCVDTVVDNVVARAVGRFSAVRNRAFAACRSLSRILWKSFFFPNGVAH